LKILCDLEKYTEARNYYNNIPLNKRGNECTYLVGMTWLYENNSLSALPYFEEIMDDDKTLGDFRAKSYFAAALCHFGLKNKEKALRTLDTLEDFLKNDENRILKLKDSGNSWMQIPDYISGYRNKSLELRKNLKNQSFPS
jgi:tetratricopeptide (TPR) repeat protein